MTINGRVAHATLMLAIFVGMDAMALGYPYKAALLPLVVGSAGRRAVPVSAAGGIAAGKRSLSRKPCRSSVNCSSSPGGAHSSQAFFCSDF